MEGRSYCAVDTVVLFVAALIKRSLGIKEVRFDSGEPVVQ